MTLDNIRKIIFLTEESDYAAKTLQAETVVMHFSIDFRVFLYTGDMQEAHLLI